MLLKQETIEHCIKEAQPLFNLHWLELYGGECPADIDKVIINEKAGDSAYFTSRTNDGQLQGHACFFIIDAPHCAAKVALDMFYYVKPEYRGAFVMARLLKFSAIELVKSGISNVIVSHAATSNISPIIKRAGFVEAGKTYTFKG